jgi:hypothetical protein
MKLKARYDKDFSWNGRQWYDLENGCKIAVEYNVFYGDLVKVICDVEGEWRANDGLDSLPERFPWAKAWIAPIAEGHWQRVMRPNLDIIPHTPTKEEGV